MSRYDDDGPRRQRSTKDRSRRDDYEDTVYDQNSRDTRVVRRRDDSVSSVEEVSRDFAPGDRGGAYYRETTVRKSGHRPIRTRSSDDWYDDRYDDRSYATSRRKDDDYTVVSKYKRREDDERSRHHKRRGSYSDYSSRSRSRSRTPPKKDRRKSTTEELLGTLGLGGLAATVLGKKSDKNRSRSRSSERSKRSRSRGGRRRSSSDTSRARNKSRGPNKAKVSQAIQAAVLAGAGEAFRARGDKGGWGGEKGKRILTAALAAGGVDGLISNNRDPDHHKKRDIVGSALAGMAANRVINGPRSKSRGREASPDSRGRSQSRGGLRDLAAGGVVATAAKKVYDSVRSRSRGRARSRSRSSSYDSRYDRSPPTQKRSRSQSVGAFAAKGLAAIGLKDAADKFDPERRKTKQNYDDYDDRSSRNGGYGYNDSGNVGTIQPHDRDQPYGGPRATSLPRAPPPGYQLDFGPRHTGDPDTDSDSDLGSSSEDEKQIKKSRKKMLLTGGLATVATIHAAHSVYGSMEKREERKKALKEGDISPAEAKKEKNKNRMQDVASIGIAALGLKGAYSEWNETRNTSKEVDEEKEKRKRHAEKREARRRKASLVGGAHDYGDNGYMNSMPNLTTLPPDPYYPGPTYAQPYSTGGSFVYSDDNPYGALTQNHNYAPSPPPPPPGSGYYPTPGIPRADTR